jgi:hypothetical protein
MVKLSAALVAAALAFGVAGGGAAFADDQSMSPMVAVPAPGGGGGSGSWGLTGCYDIQGKIYGPYRMSFCLRGNGGGSYQVNGGGLNCNGGLDWYTGKGNRVDIDLYRSKCGRGTQWTGDSLNCRSTWNLLGGGGGKKPTVAVPVPGGGNRLNCTYNPQASGYYPTQVTAIKN